MSQKLIVSQEQERTRIARELHDDIGQRLAVLAIDIIKIQQDYPDLHVELRGRLDQLGQETAEIVNDVQSLSHELHSSTLEYLGLVAALKSFCRQFGEHQQIQIDFQSQSLPSVLPADISLCLFRVFQEALHNSIKH